jgi:hypothetical protein
MQNKPIVQVTGRYPEAIDFFNKSGCKTLFELNGDNLRKSLNALLRAWFFDHNISANAIDALGDKVEQIEKLLCNNQRHVL